MSTPGSYGAQPPTPTVERPYAPSSQPQYQPIQPRYQIPQPEYEAAQVERGAGVGAIAFVLGIIAVLLAYGWGIFIRFVVTDGWIDPVVAIVSTVLGVLAVIIGLFALGSQRGRAMAGFGLALGLVTLLWVASTTLQYRSYGFDLGTGLRYTFAFYDDGYWRLLG